MHLEDELCFFYTGATRHLAHNARLKIDYVKWRRVSRCAWDNTFLIVGMSLIILCFQSRGGVFRAIFINGVC